MTKLENFVEKNTSHDFSCVYAFITKDNYGYNHLYVVGYEDTVIDLSVSTQDEYHAYETVEELAEEKNETILEIFTSYDDFCITISKNRG